MIIIYINLQEAFPDLLVGQRTSCTHPLGVEIHLDWSMEKESHRYQGIWHLRKVYLPELLERVSGGRSIGGDSNQSICINFTVFSFVMANNNKNVGGLFGCNFTFCVPNKHLWFFKFDIFKNIWIYQYDFRCFLDKDSFSIPEEFVFFDFKVHEK